MPVLAGGFLYTMIVLASPFPYGVWLGWQMGSARRTSDNLFRVMTASWNPDDIMPLADDHLRQSWPPTDRRHTFASLSELGSLAEDHPARTQIASSEFDSAHKSFWCVANTTLDR